MSSPGSSLPLWDRGCVGGSLGAEWGEGPSERAAVACDGLPKSVVKPKIAQPQKRQLRVAEVRRSGWSVHRSNPRAILAVAWRVRLPATIFASAPRGRVGPPSPSPDLSQSGSMKTSVRLMRVYRHRGFIESRRSCTVWKGADPKAHHSRAALTPEPHLVEASDDQPHVLRGR